MAWRQIKAENAAIEASFKLAPEELRRQWKSAAQAAGRKFILTPGCSVPNESAPEELARLPGVVGA